MNEELNNQIEMFDPVTKFLGPTDPRMADYPLMESFRTPVILSSIYLLFILVIGPKWMEKRKPYDLRTFMVLYNIALVYLNGWIFINLLKYGWITTYSWRCEPIDFSNNHIALFTVRIMWVFYVSKIIEFLDTVIFVLRKKDSQINFLHLFHHSTVPLTTWLSISYGPGGYNTFFGVVNSLTHVWMYSYYGLAAIGPEIQKFLWWKKYLTLMQMAQFLLVVLYFTHLCIFAPKSCNVSPLLVCLSLGQAVIYLGLFAHFYFKSYKCYRASKNGNGNSRQNKEE